MAYKCARCGKTVPKLVPIDDAYRSSQYTELIGIPYPCTDYVCITCAREVIGISDRDLVQEERVTNIETEFLLNLLKGRLAQVVIETIFREFGYEVYPYGYERYLTSIMKFMTKGDASVAARKVRASPDLFVYDRESNDGFFVETKATNSPDESNFWISKSTLDTYLTHWPEVVLVVYCIRSMNIYCRSVRDIHPDELPIKRSRIIGRDNYTLNLKDEFESLPDHFRLIESSRYVDLCRRIKGILKEFNQF
jgi:DNA-directed RNA polymerase subunit RPC12/RpoP